MVGNQFYKRCVYSNTKTRTQERKKINVKRKQTENKTIKLIHLLTSMLNYCPDVQSTVGSLCPVWVYPDLS